MRNHPVAPETNEDAKAQERAAVFAQHQQEERESEEARIRAEQDNLEGERRDREVRERTEEEARTRAEIEVRVRTEREARERAELEARERVELETRERAEREAQEQADIARHSRAMANAPAAVRNWEKFAQALFRFRPSLPEFHGQDHENPETYLEHCTSYLTAYNIPDDQKVFTLEKGLKNDAEKWWQCYYTVGVNWQRFQELIRTRHNSQSVISSLTAKLYDKKQGEKDVTGTFL